MLLLMQVKEVLICCPLFFFFFLVNTPVAVKTPVLVSPVPLPITRTILNQCLCAEFGMVLQNESIGLLPSPIGLFPPAH